MSCDKRLSPTGEFRPAINIAGYASRATGELLIRLVESGHLVTVFWCSAQVRYSLLALGICPANSGRSGRVTG